MTYSEFALGVQRLAEQTHTVSSKLPIQIRENQKAMFYRLLESLPLKLGRHLELRSAQFSNARYNCIRTPYCCERFEARVLTKRSTNVLPRSVSHLNKTLLQSAVYLPSLSASVHQRISGFRRDVGEICALLGYYGASSSNSVPTFSGNLPDPSSFLTPWPFRMGPACPETSVRDYNSTQRNIAEERRS